MEIGQKLKNARTASGLTQELIAEKLGRFPSDHFQLENEKSYPDIVSVIALSDLYSISLDDLLKGDQNMMEHLEQSTNLVKAIRS